MRRFVALTLSASVTPDLLKRNRQTHALQKLADLNVAMGQVRHERLEVIRWVLLRIIQRLKNAGQLIRGVFLSQPFGLRGDNPRKTSGWAMS